MKRLAAIAIVAMLVLLAGGARAKDPKDDGPPPASVDELRARVATILREENVTGGVGLALVKKDGVVWAGGVGKADVERGVDVDEATLFRVGSITKSFVALAVMKLVEEGKLDLAARAKALVPDVAIENAWESTRPITLAHLLEHTAGFDDMHMSELVAPGDTPLRDVLALQPRSRVARWQPGTRMSYANPGYTVVGYAIERATGRRYEDYLKDAVLAPLGMTASTLYVRPDEQPKLARGYGPRRKPVAYVSIAHRPAGNLLSSPAELAHLVEAMLNEGTWHGTEVVSAASVSRIETCATLPYGLSEQYGLGNYGETEEGFGTRGHDGGIDGFVSEYRYARREGFGWVMLFNSTMLGNAPKRIRHAILGLLSKDVEKPKPLPEVDVPKETLAQYAGYYRVANPRNQLFAFVDTMLAGRRVTLEGDRLVTHAIGAEAKPLIPLGPATFRRDDTLGAVWRFGKDERGAPIAIAKWTYLERTPEWPILTARAGFVAALFWSMTTLPFFLVWGPRWLFSKRFRARAHARVRAAPLLATVLLLATSVAVAGLDGIVAAGTVNAATVALFVGPMLFVAISAAALAMVIRSLARRQPVNRFAQAHSLAAAIANAVLSGYFVAWGLVGLRLWAY